MQINKIKSQFKEVIAYSQNIDNPQIDDLIDKWLDAKSDFIEAMGGKLIYEWPEKVSFELGLKEKNLRVDDFIELVSNRWRNYDLADFIYAQKNGFFSNQVVNDYCYNDNKIPKGMKLLRAFKFFIEDSKVLNDIQSAASMIIQEDKIEGTLCLSVHPLDYLSSSENNHNWRSCHALDGEYRAGNLSHMIDKSTIICYLKSNKPEVLPDFPDSVKWNSKKWRVLLFFSDDWKTMFAGRQYPFTTETGMDFIKDNLLPRINMGNWTDWFKKKIKKIEENDITFFTNSPYIPFGGKLISLDELIINEPGSLQFNDLLYSSCYDPIFAFRESGWRKKEPYFMTDFKAKPPKIRVGGKVKCVKCGKQNVELAETMMCFDCELAYGSSENDMFGYCNCCGSRFIFDDGVWVDQTEETICSSCGDYYIKSCSNCGETYYESDMIYDEKLEELFCKWCFEDLAYER